MLAKHQTTSAESPPQSSQAAFITWSDPRELKPPSEYWARPARLLLPRPRPLNPALSDLSSARSTATAEAGDRLA